MLALRLILFLSFSINAFANTNAAEKENQVELKEKAQAVLKDINQSLNALDKSLKQFSKEKDIDEKDKTQLTACLQIVDLEIGLMLSNNFFTLFDAVYTLNFEKYAEEKIIYPWVEVITEFYKIKGYCNSDGEVAGVPFNLDLGWYVRSVAGADYKGALQITRKMKANINKLEKTIKRLPKLYLDLSEIEKEEEEVFEGVNTGGPYFVL